MSGVLNWINEWHRRAKPEPTMRDFEVQLGCHLEEVAEMLESFDLHQDRYDEVRENARQLVAELGNLLKTGHADVRYDRIDREGLLDSLGDQVVTAVGVGYRAKMDVVNAITEVDISNWSKFDEKGLPIFDENGKIQKGPNYKPPELGGLY
jgi:hypothetical protein